MQSFHGDRWGALGAWAVLAVSSVLVLACGQVELDVLELGAEDGVPPVDINNVELSGLGVDTCTGSMSIAGSDGVTYDVNYTETAGGGCLITFASTVQVFSLADAMAANETLGDGASILQVNDVELVVTGFALSDPSTGMAFDTGPANVNSLSMVVDGSALNVDLDGPFPQTVALGDETVGNITTGVSTGTAVDASIDLSVSLTPTGRAAFPDPIAIDFHAQPIITVGVALH